MDFAILLMPYWIHCSSANPIITPPISKPFALLVSLVVANCAELQLCVMHSYFVIDIEEVPPKLFVICKIVHSVQKKYFLGHFLANEQQAEFENVLAHSRDLLSCRCRRIFHVCLFWVLHGTRQQQYHENYVPNLVVQYQHLSVLYHKSYHESTCFLQGTLSFLAQSVGCQCEVTSWCPIISYF